MGGVSDLIVAVRAHAMEHYNDGWDVVVEAYDDAQLTEMIGRARTVKGAIGKVAEVVEVVDDRRRDIEGTRF